jgi:hypothetical protein
VFFHESRNVTIERAKRGGYKTAKPYKKNKVEAWIISTDELLEIMNSNREQVPRFTARLEIVLKSDNMPSDKDEAQTYAGMIFDNIYESYTDDIDYDNSDYFVEEVESYCPSPRRCALAVGSGNSSQLRVPTL